MADMANTMGNDLEQFVCDNSVTYGYYIIQDIINRYDAALLELRRKYSPELLKTLQEVPDEYEKVILKSYVNEKLCIDFTDVLS
jgi:hypothetical protein